MNVVSIIDLRQRKVIRTIGMDEYDLGAGNPWDVACTADGKSVCVSLAGTHELCVIDSAELLSDAARIMSPMMGVWPIYTSLGDSLWRRIKLPGKGPRGLAVAGSKVYVAEYFSDTRGRGRSARGRRAPPSARSPWGPPPQLTPERRGELLFHDATICYQHWQSCASCHPDGRMRRPELGPDERRRWAIRRTPRACCWPTRRRRPCAEGVRDVGRGGGAVGHHAHPLLPTGRKRRRRPSTPI